MKTNPTFVAAALMLAVLNFANAQATLSGDDFAKPIMFGSSHGWRQGAMDEKSTILYTDDGGKHWLDVSPSPLKSGVEKWPRARECTAISPLDAQRAWVSITPWNSQVVLLEYTADAGKHWKESVVPVATDRARISFVDELHGFLLATSDPAAGSMDKKVYGTEDGGKHWHWLAAPPALGCYPTGISFRSSADGWITATYHGGDAAPLYHTRDGGKNWALQKLNIPDDYRGGYADTYPPVFIGAAKKQGYLPVKLVRHAPVPGHYAWVNYETQNGGETWTLPTAGIPSVSDE